MSDVLPITGLNVDHHRVLKNRERINVSLEGSGGNIRVTRPNTGGRYFLNFLAATQVLKWTRGLYNRYQWRALQQVLSRQAAGSLTDAQIENILSTYDPSNSLTMGKLKVVLDRFERARSGDVKALHVSKTKPLRYSAKQSWRAARSLTQKLHLKTGERKNLSNYFSELQSHPVNKVASDARDAQLAVTRNAKIGGHSVSQAIGQIELNNNARGAESRHFASTFHATNHGNPLEAIENAILTRYKNRNDQQALNLWNPHQFAIPPQDRKGIMTIPLGLIGKRFTTSENHIVNLTIDFDQKKILYLDSKATPLDEAHKHYVAGDRLLPALTELGEKYFGNQWSAESGIVQLQNPKQLGANDCGPFTIEFAQRLANGESVAVIDRNFSPADRAKLRVNAGRLLRQHLEHEIDAATANDIAQREEPTPPRGAQNVGAVEDTGEFEFV